MKRLNELYDCPYDTWITGIKINSKEVEPGDLFVCTMGVNFDRHDFVPDALARGAVAIVARKQLNVDVPVIYVLDPNQELPLLMSRFCDKPEDKLKLIGITGTNGKTIVAEIVQDLLGNDICGYIGTNGLDCKNFHQSIRNTTPDADRLFPYLKQFVDKGCSYVSMETSSEAFFRHRLDTLRFDISILTTITQDHLNIHKTLENYIDSKCQLFRNTKEGGTSILNIDDAHYEKVRDCCSQNLLTYGQKKDATLCFSNVTLFADHTEFEIVYKGQKYLINSPLTCLFNVYNLCAGLLTLIAFGFSIEDAIKRIKRIQTIAGRLELVHFGQEYQIILDYAHTPDALRNILTFLKEIKKGRIITVTGSAGGREVGKRPLMGKIVLDYSDYIIFTMDDPRYEDVNAIIDDLVSSSDKTNYERILNRGEAITRALDLAEKDDIVLIAGKGRDNYMAVKDQYLDYCDYDEIKKYFQKKEK